MSIRGEALTMPDGQGTTLQSNKWQQFLLLYVITLLFVGTLGYDPCPEALRPNAKSPAISDSDVQQAFEQAKARVNSRKLLEKKLVAEGRTVNLKIKSPESTHPQASARPVTREMENRQLQFEEASHILTKQHKLNARQVTCDLPKLALRSPAAASAIRECTPSETIQCDANARYRTADGTCNNLNYPTMGSALSCFNRILPSVYTGDSGFRLSVDGSPLPPPRRLSRNVHPYSNRPTNYVNHMYMFFGQLLDHDISLTSQSLTDDNQAIECCPPRAENHPQCAPIEIPADDPFYSQFGVTCLNFVRSSLCPFCTAGPRVQVNEVTAPIDASFIYGNSENQTNNLRVNDGSGLLLMQNSAVGDLLPQSTDPQNDQCSLPAQNQICFRSGDSRVNQHPTLTSLHTIFHREHNRVARILRSLNPSWTEETLFQETRKIMGALMQVITYGEYLPVTLGNERMDYFNLWISNVGTDYNPNFDPTLLTEFSTAAFRFGHTMINTLVSEIPGQAGHNGHQLRDMFFYPFDLYTGEMDPLLRGGTRSPAQFFNRYVVPDVTNYLYRVRGNDTGFDLPAFNIQRGRDHGLQRYVEYVRFCSKGQILVRSWNDLVYYELMDPSNRDVLRNNYRSVQDIDLFTGTMAEMYREGAVLGPTATCIVGIQFEKLKFGDRFYFQHTGQAGSFTSAQVAQLKRASLAKIICDNTGISEMQRKAMLFISSYNPLVSCNQIAGINFAAWQQ